MDKIKNELDKLKEKFKMEYKFYGSDTPSIKPINPDFTKVKDQRHLYDLLSDIWCEYSCAPRYRKDWSKENKTLGQCSISSYQYTIISRYRCIYI